MPEGVVPLRPFPLQQRFGLAVALLLLPVSSDRVAAVVPDQRRRIEAEGPPPLLESPADIHVVTRHPESRVEAADRLELVFPEGHIAARNVFGYIVRQQEVD